jgi:choline dehydrogenase
MRIQAIDIHELENGDRSHLAHRGPRAASREDMIDLARTASASFGHAVGTAKIGADADAVVDSKLRVHGLRGLRVADASVMPSIISGPGTNAASYMIGGRAAELMKADT